MRYRTATTSDLDALIAFYGEICDAMVGTPFDCQWRRGLHPSDEMLAEAVSAGTLTIADDCGTIAAAVIVNGSYDASTSPSMPWIVDCPPSKMAVIHVLAAGTAYRGTGAARGLLLHVIDKARADSLHTLRLGAAANNTPAVKLYEGCGFKRIIESRQWFGGVEVDAVSFELPLEQHPDERTAMAVTTTVWHDVYHDSVTLMLGSSLISAMPGIEEAMVLMGTNRNETVIRASGLVAEDTDPFGANDIVIGIRAADEASAQAALDALEEFLTSKKGAGDRMVSTRTLDGALREDPGIDFAMISVPGRYARAEAEKALGAGLHVMMFSDNVSLEDEIAVKDLALEKGLLMMGPDCGTAIVNGCALGFANVVRRGTIGLVAAAGTGLQEITVLIDRLGGGVSQALGTGGRDLKEKVGGRMMSLCLEALRDDPATEVIAILSKPPHPTVVEKMKAIIATIGKPVVACFLGAPEDALAGTHAVYAKDCEQCARIAVELAGIELAQEDEAWLGETAAAEAARLAPGQRYLRGLYSGGTLAYEAMLACRDAGITAYSNIAIDRDLLLANPDVSRAHTIVDMGEDFFTNGMPHPMIDLRMRIERIARDCAAGDVAVLLLDCVGGYGTHDDPAGALAPAIVAAKAAVAGKGGHLSVIASVTASEADPQVRSAQERKLRDAGAIVCSCNAQAVRLALAIVQNIDA